ncbi:MAG: hypothetical protein MO846_06330 [Candidatus Devosia symbiotica]|nr:hypothetical protein [Candidatus Devosia symbiotica]
MFGDGHSTTIVNVADNTAGMTIWTSNVTIDGFRFTGNSTPVNAIGVLVDGGAGAVSNILIGDADADLLGNCFTGLTTGLHVDDGFSSNAIGIEIGVGNVFDNSQTGMLFSVMGVDIVGDTFNNIDFANLAGNYIFLLNRAEFVHRKPTFLNVRSAF